MLGQEVSENMKTKLISHFILHTKVNSRLIRKLNVKILTVGIFAENTK